MEQSKELVFRKECPCCKNSTFHSYLTTKDYFLSQEEFTLVRCSVCDLVFTNPIPKPDKLPEYYNSPDYLSHKVSKWSLTGFVYNVLRNINLARKFKMLSRFSKTGKILDIGQGTGEFLNYMKQKGWEVKGVEPNISARKFAIDHYNLSVVDESEIPDLPNHYFDLVTMWHVLEHVMNPGERLAQIKRILKGTGYLVVAVPNLNSPDSLKYKEKWAALDVPRHLYHFTRETMTFLLNENGFDVISEYPLTLDAYYVSLLSEKHNKNRFPYPLAFVNGFISNSKARKKNNYSSMVFVAKPI